MCWLTAIEARVFKAWGIVVLAQSSLDRDDEYSRVNPLEIRSLIAQINRADLSRAQAIILSCAGWPTLDLIARFENSFGMTVLSSNLAMAIHAMTRTRLVQ